jgi:hypothetical protein
MSERVIPGNWSGIPRQRRYWNWQHHCWEVRTTFDVGRQDGKRVHLPDHPIYNKGETDSRPVEQQIEDYLSTHGSASVAELNSQLRINAERIEAALGDFPDLFVSYRPKKSPEDSKRRLWKLV